MFRKMSIVTEYAALKLRKNLVLVLIFQDAKKNKHLKLIKIKKVSFLSEDHNDIFNHKYHIDPGNLFSIY